MTMPAAHVQKYVPTKLVMHDMELLFSITRNATQNCLFRFVQHEVLIDELVCVCVCLCFHGISLNGSADAL